MLMSIRLRAETNKKNWLFTGGLGVYIEVVAETDPFKIFRFQKGVDSH